MLDDPMFWYAVAFLLFLGVSYRYARKPVLGWLDAEIVKIRGELERARQLRTVAEATLADYKKKHAEAMREAEDIVRYAREEAVNLKKQAEADLKSALARQEQQAGERIRLAEAEAVAAVRSAVIDEAMADARKALDAPGSGAGALADQAIAELPKLAAISKAA